MRPTVRLVLITAFRDRLFPSLLGLQAIALIFSLIIGGALILEAQASILVFAGGSVRVLLALGLTIFVALHIERLYETRELEAILSRSVSRETFVFSYWLGIVLVALVLTVPLTCFFLYFHMSFEGALWWVSSLILELLIIVAFASAAAVILERAIPAIFATVGFYILSRLVGFLTGIAAYRKQDGINEVANPIFDVIAMLIPRLDIFGQTRWLVYGPDPQDAFFWIALQVLIYVPLLFFMMAFDLNRKNF